ncbi:MAG TPA: hypothetical protein VGV09_05000, partial [Steroidobacteraceae bacterium]|nr:hypothetical protein [Steroidobacteraceae bacterium]
WVACGLLRLAHLPRPALWDAAAGLTLVKAAGCGALTWEGGHWRPLERFTADGTSQAALAAWRQPVLIGAPEDLAAAQKDPRP